MSAPTTSLTGPAVGPRSRGHELTDGRGRPGSPAGRRTSGGELRSRNETEGAILGAARRLLAKDSHQRLTIDQIAKRAYVSRTSVYFYFENKRAVMDRLIQQAFADMHLAGAPYFDGKGEPRMELRLALGRIVAMANRNGKVLLLAAHLSGEEEHLPVAWEPYISRFVDGAAARIARDQQRGIAPDDISPRIVARALCAMVERHLTVEVIRGRGEITESISVLAELWWRAAYAPGMTTAPPNVAAPTTARVSEAVR